MTEGFLPVCQEDLQKRNITQLDFVYITGDAYVDHPSFGHAVISRVLDAHGYSVGILAQPDWKQEDSILALGIPRLAFLVSGGNMDSMVNHYYVSKKKRQTDAYSPGGVMGKRPDHAPVVYANMIRRSCHDIPIIVGGIEASLRRMAHYDYWSDSMKRSLLLDSQADLISYGMGENSILEIADALAAGIAVKDLTFIRGTVYKTKSLDHIHKPLLLPSYESLKQDSKKYAESFAIQSEHTDAVTAEVLVERYPHDIYVVQNPPQPVLSTEQMDEVYGYPYQRTYHPQYEQAGGIPAIEEVRFSLISNRGCFGGCNFCALTFHQGRTIQVRSHESLLQEACEITKQEDFKGYIHDVGGPTANFRHPSCQKQIERGVCKKKQCLYPTACPNIDSSHADYMELLQKLRSIPKIKKVFIRSGIRYDYLLLDTDKTFLEELVQYHISGQLKIAPEHISDKVLDKMGKPKKEVYERFRREYIKCNEKYSKNQFLVPYFMSSHPGSGLKEAIELAEYLRDLGISPEQVQDFYPTPSTMSTVMYATGLDPRSMEHVSVCKNPHEKAMQRALIQYKNPKNYELVQEALRIAGREDLIGFGDKCLIRPRRQEKDDYRKQKIQKGKAQNSKTQKPQKKKVIRNVHKKAK